MTRELIISAYQRTDLDPAANAQDLAAAIAELEQPQLALKKSEPRLDGPMSKALEDALRPIGAAIDPRIADEQAKVWRKALLLKLSNLPGRLAVKATQAAAHEPFEFFSQVEKVIRQKADEAKVAQEVALMRLQRWQRELERAAVPQIEAPPQEWTEESIAEANEIFAKAGIKTRYRLEGGECVSFTEQIDAEQKEA
jgi:hypothetical protein